VALSLPDGLPGLEFFSRHLDRHERRNAEREENPFAFVFNMNLLVAVAYLSREPRALCRYCLEQLVMSVGVGSNILGIVQAGGSLQNYPVKMLVAASALKKEFVFDSPSIRAWSSSSTYLDNGVYLHACHIVFMSVTITFNSYGAVLQWSTTFAGLPPLTIPWSRCLMLENIRYPRAKGGLTIGNRVSTSPFTPITPSPRFDDPPQINSFEQGITAPRHIIEMNVWLGSGAI